MRSVVFYISAHGFGHSTRQIAIINALIDAAPDLAVVVRTNAPAWLFERTVRGSIRLEPGETDTGVSQIDGLRLDERATVANALEFYRDADASIDREAARLRQLDASLVVSDAPPLACAAAARAGIRSAVCANFTWDWIYEDYAGARAGGRGLVADVRPLYSMATAGWRLPMHGGFEPIADVTDVPLVARHSTRTREEVRAALRLPRERRLVLVSFGGYGVRDLPLHRLDCLDAWDVVLTAPGEDAGVLPAGVHGIAEERLYASNLRYEDLVRAVDVVLTKPGYGIISDCIANGTAMLYTPRGAFREYDVLVREIPRFLRCQFLPMDAFVLGRWLEGLEWLAAAPAPPEQMPANGADVVAGMILRSRDA